MRYLHMWVFACSRCRQPIVMPAIFPEPGYDAIEEHWDRFDVRCTWCCLLQTVFARNGIRIEPQPWSPPVEEDIGTLSLFDTQFRLQLRRPSKLTGAPQDSRKRSAASAGSSPKR